ncbi:MAG: flagellar basal body rod C-terminal domain-containing protein [Pirellulales bacterium]
MSLLSVLQTAHTGLSAAVVMVDVVSHNVANSRTNGYKTLRPVNVTQLPGERDAAISVGTGVRVAGLAVDESQGPLVVAPYLTMRDAIRFEEEAWDAELPTAIEEQLIAEGAVELSNTDIGDKLIELILAEEQFLENASVFETADEMLGDLVHLTRSR